MTNLNGEYDVPVWLRNGELWMATQSIEHPGTQQGDVYVTMATTADPDAEPVLIAAKTVTDAQELVLALRHAGVQLECEWALVPAQQVLSLNRPVTYCADGHLAIWRPQQQATPIAPVFQRNGEPAQAKCCGTALFAVMAGPRAGLKGCANCLYDKLGPVRWDRFVALFPGATEPQECSLEQQLAVLDQTPRVGSRTRFWIACQGARVNPLHTRYCVRFGTPVGVSGPVAVIAGSQQQIRDTEAALHATDVNLPKCWLEIPAGAIGLVRASLGLAEFSADHWQAGFPDAAEYPDGERFAPDDVRRYHPHRELREIPGSTS